MWIKFCSILLALSLALPSAAVPPPPNKGLYGPEFTFTFTGEVPDANRIAYLNHLRTHLIDNQPERAKFGESNNTFISPNNWWFEVTTNPGVLEIKMSPLSVADTRRFKADIQDAIFVSAANVGLFPWEFLGGGHINFDYRIFGGKLLLARNFVVDFWNHNELSMGILSFDTNNALPMPLFIDEDIESVRAVLAKADTPGGYSDDDAGIALFLGDINTLLANGDTRLGRSRPYKYRDLNFSHSGRVEIRSVRPQANMDVWLNQIELIESRINNHLRFIEEPLPLRFRIPLPRPWVNKGVVNNQIYVPPIDPQAALRSFYLYVTESGLKWKDHRGYIWPDWFRHRELKKFEASKFFKDSERLKSQKRPAQKLNCDEALASDAKQ